MPGPCVIERIMTNAALPCPDIRILKSIENDARIVVDEAMHVFFRQFSENGLVLQQR